MMVHRGVKWFKGVGKPQVEGEQKMVHGSKG